MKKYCLVFVLGLTTTVALGASGFAPFSNNPPKAENIGEIMFYQTDFFHNSDKYITVSRETFLKFFTHGTFSADYKTMEEIKRMSPDLNSQGSRNLCTGHFATKEGKIYEFKRYNPRALEISDIDYKTGWLILPE